MPEGDIAAAAGMDIVAGTEDLRRSYLEINKTRDLLVTHQTVGTHAATAITSGVFNSGRIPNLPASQITSGTLNSGRIPNLPASQITSGTFNPDRIPPLTAGVIPDLPASRITSGTLTVPVSTSGGGRFGAAFDNNIVSTRRSVWMTENGSLGYAASSRRYKTAIRRAEIDPLAILDAVEVVHYQPRMTLKDGQTAPTHVGVIAEQLHDAGLWEFIFYDDKDRPEGVHYDLLSLAALTAVQHVWKEHKLLAARVQAIEEGAA